MSWNLVTYANEKFVEQQDYLNTIAVTNGFNTIPYSREDIEKTEFYKDNKEILDSEMGDGYWLWKPYVILDAMNKLDEGDVILYDEIKCSKCLDKFCLINSLIFVL